MHQSLSNFNVKKPREYNRSYWISRKFLHSPLWLWFILFIALSILVYIACIYYLPPSIMKKIPSNLESYKEILNTVKNGDLIFWGGDSFTEKVVRFYHRSFYNHISFVLVDDEGANDDTRENTVFVWEADVGQRYRKGPRLLRLSEKLERWKGQPIAMLRRWQGRELAKEEIHSIVDEYLKKGTGMDMSMLCWAFSNYPNSFIFKYLKGDNVVFCSELVADTLQKLGTIEKEHHPAWYTPAWFSQNQEFIEGSYSDPIYFTLPAYESKK